MFIDKMVTLAKTLNYSIFNPCEAQCATFHFYQNHFETVNFSCDFTQMVSYKYLTVPQVAVSVLPP